jgi:hypothetical protein
MTSNGPAQPPNGPDQRPPAAAGPALTGAPAPGRTGVDLGRLRLADCAVAAGTLLYLIFALLPWYTVDGFDLGSGYSFPDASANGFDSGTVVLAFVLLLLATAWALLPAVAELPGPFPRSSGTAALSAPAVLLTLIEWLSDLDLGFTWMGLLTLLSSVAVLAFAVLRLLAELGHRTPLPGRLAAAVQWAGRPAPGRSSSGQLPASPPVPGGPEERPSGS